MSTCRVALAVLVVSLISQLAAAQEKKPPLVTRDRVVLNLAGAQTILAAAQKQAATMELKLNIAIVDDGGHLLAFVRMDGTGRPAATPPDQGRCCSHLPPGNRAPASKGRAGFAIEPQSAKHGAGRWRQGNGARRAARPSSSTGRSRACRRRRRDRRARSGRG